MIIILQYKHLFSKYLIIFLNTFDVQYQLYVVCIY